jgi:hypothetical protein
MKLTLIVAAAVYALAYVQAAGVAGTRDDQDTYWYIRHPLIAAEFVTTRPVVAHDADQGERASVMIAWALQHLDIVGAMLTDPPPSMRAELRQNLRQLQQ